MTLLKERTPEQQAWDYAFKIVHPSTPSPMEIVNKYHEEALTKDVVNHPDHYQGDRIECIEYLKDNMPWEAYTGYLEGNVKKYLHRWRRKGKPVEDIKKARWYLDRLILELETEGNDG